MGAAAPLPGASERRRVAVAGARGFLGRALTAALTARGDTVLGIGRGGQRSPVDIEWDPAAGRLDLSALDGVDVVVNLTGTNLGRRWTRAARREIVESRIGTTRLLADTMSRMTNPPGVFVSMSGIGYYGDRGDEPLDEDAPPGRGFLAELATAWEAAARFAARAGIRVVTPRLAPVMHPDSGPLERLLPLFRLCLGARIASGRQWLSWIGLTDAVRVLLTLIDDAALEGPVNAASPEPVRNSEFTRVLAAVVHRPALLVVPRLAVWLMYGRMGLESVVAGQRVVPRKLLDAGFRFAYPDLAGAIEHELAD